MEAPSDVVPAAPLFVSATPIHKLAKAPIVRRVMDFPRKKYWRSATHGVVMILASLSMRKFISSSSKGIHTGKTQLSCTPN